MSDMVFEDNRESYCSKALLSLYTGTDVNLHFAESNSLLLKKLKEIISNRKEDDISSILIFIDVPPENKNAIGRYKAIHKYIIKNKLSNVMLVPIICIEYVLLSSVQRLLGYGELPNLLSRDRTDYRDFLRMRGKPDTLENFSKFIANEDNLLCLRKHMIKKGVSSYLEEDCCYADITRRVKEEYFLTSLPVWCTVVISSEFRCRDVELCSVYRPGIDACHSIYATLGYDTLLN